SRGLSVKAEAGAHIDREDDLHLRDGEGDEEEENGGDAAAAVPEDDAEALDVEALGAVRGADFAADTGLFELEEGKNEVGQRERGAGEHRRSVAIARENSADGGAEDEAQPEARADQAHALGALLPRGDVGDVGV